MKAQSFQSVLLNYEAQLIALHDTTGSGHDGVSNFEVTSKAGGIYRSLETFDILFRVMLGERMFSITDSLSCSLQAKRVRDCLRCESCIWNCYKKKIMSLRSDEGFNSFWDKAVAKAQCLKISNPVLLQTRRPPRHLNSGSEPHSYSSPKVNFYEIYFEFANNIHGELTRRIDQDNYHLYINAE